MSSRYNLLSLMPFGFYQNKLSLSHFNSCEGRQVNCNFSFSCYVKLQMFRSACSKTAFVFTSPPEQIGALHDSLHFQTLKNVYVCTQTQAHVCTHTEQLRVISFFCCLSIFFSRGVGGGRGSTVGSHLQHLFSVKGTA